VVNYDQTPTTIDDYISRFPPEIQERLQKIRQVIHEEAPDALEKISYRMPTFYLKGNLVHFAAFKNHIGFYPTASGIEAFQAEFSQYHWSKGAMQFPLNQPIPYELIRRITAHRVKENLAKK